MAMAALGGGTATAAARPRVAVVGAGFAGLAAALALQRSGCCEVVLLEAGGRPGGRACTQTLPGGGIALELGATWLHGLGTPEEPNPVFRQAVEHGLISANPQAEKWWSSQFLLPGATQPLSKPQQIAVTHALAAWMGTVEELPEDAEGTTAEHLEEAWRQLLASGVLAPEQLVLAQRAWRWREHLQRAMDGCDSTAVQSARGLALYDEMPGGVHCAMPGGMQAVAERLAAAVHDLRYQHAVQRIIWAGGPGSSSKGNEGSSSRVSIACSNGATIEADAAVVTVSLGVLKAQHRQLFDPPLPADKAAAIERLSIGTVDKLILDFSSGSSSSSSVGQGPAAIGGEASSSGGAHGPAVSYALLWSALWEGSASGGSKAGRAAQAAAAAVPEEEQLPEWALGVFSIRFGGPEVKRLPPAGGNTGSLGGEQQEAAQQAQQAGRQAGQEVATGPSAREGEEEEPEYNPCAETQQPSCYQAVAWVTGEAARAMEAASDEEVLRVLRQLAALYPQLQLPPGASWNAVTLYRSGWGSDPLFRGSYSYLGAGSTPVDVAALAAPVHAPDGSGASGGASARGGAPVLLFAGEACHVKYIGTMHGAYLTGQAAADTLVRAWQGTPAQLAAAGAS